MEVVMRFEPGCALSPATHKQDERAFVFYREKKWEYSLSKPKKIRSEMVVDAEEAYNIVRKRNKIMGIIEK